MRILCTSAIDLSKHGADTTHFLEVAANLVAEGHAVTILTPGYAQPQWVPAGVGLRLVPVPRKSLLSYGLYELLSTFYLLWLILSWLPDAIYCRFYPLTVIPGIISRLTRTTYVVEVNGVMDEELALRGMSPLLVAVARITYLFNCRMANRIVCVTRGLAEDLARRGVRPTKIRVVPNGANTDKFRPMERTKSRQLLQIPEEDFLVVYVGSLAPWQGVDVLLKAVAVAGPGYRALVVGSGEERAGLVDLAAKLGIADRVTFAGTVPYEDVPRYMAAGNLMFLYKVHLAGGFSPLKVHEYLACGRPIVANDFDGAAFLSENGLGYVVPTGHVEAVADVFKRHRLVPTDGEQEARCREYALEHGSWLGTARQVAQACQRG